ncbi:hypothetical protein Tco_0916495 [Tanacetum coccineum]
MNTSTARSPKHPLKRPNDPFDTSYSICLFEELNVGPTSHSLLKDWISLVGLDIEEEILQSERRYLMMARPNMENDGAQVMNNNNNKAIRASRFVPAYQSMQEHQYITNLAEAERMSAEKIVQGKSKQISSTPEGKTVDEAVNEGSMSSSWLKLLSVAEQLLSVAEQVSDKSALEKNLGEALEKTTADLSTGGKGILAADESARTMETEEHCVSYFFAHLMRFSTLVE